MKPHLLGAVCALFFPAIAYAATIIDTTVFWDGFNAIYSFGETNSATYGQTFTVPDSDTQLDSFSFFLDDHLNPDFVDFQAYVMEWDGSKATGPILFQSGAMSTTNNEASDGFEKITIKTGGLHLISGTKYVAFFNASNQFDGIIGTAAWGILGTPPDPYSEGEFVYMNNGDDFSLLTSAEWHLTSSNPVFDSVFIMSFVPIPPSVWLFSSGLLGLIGIARRRE